MIVHFSLEWLRARCADPRRFGEEEWFDFAGHLARGCRRCWSVVGQLPAAASPWGDRGGEPAAIKRSSDPLVESLYHLRSPGSWITLSSDLFEAVIGARVRPLGFAFVLLEEALELAVDTVDDEPLRKASDPSVRLRAVFKLGRLAARLVEVDPEHELCGRRALVALETMEGDAAAMVDHADPSTRALWLLIQSRLAAVSDPERGEAAYELLPSRAAATLSPASSLPRFVPESRP